MLFMVIEHIADVEAVGRRFAERGRLMPSGVDYHASWGAPDGSRWFQIMEAADQALIEEWARRWADLMRVEIHPVLTSRQFWAHRAASGAGADPYDDSRGG